MSGRRGMEGNRETRHLARRQGRNENPLLPSFLVAVSPRSSFQRSSRSSPGEREGRGYQSLSGSSLRIASRALTDELDSSSPCIKVYSLAREGTGKLSKPSSVQTEDSATVQATCFDLPLQSPSAPQPPRKVNPTESILVALSRTGASLPPRHQRRQVSAGERAGFTLAASSGRTVFCAHQR